MASTTHSAKPLKRLLLLDPGLVSTLSASRGTLSVVVSFILVSIFAHQMGQPPTLAFLGVLVAMMGSITVSDPKREQQMVTMAILPFPASLAFALSIALHPMPRLQLACFLVVTFIAVSIRRFGPRWMAVGMVCFMAFFAPLFFPIGVSAIPSVILSVFLASLISFLVRFYVLADRPELQLRLLLKAFDVRVERLLEELERALRSNAQDFSKVESEFLKLNEVALTLDQHSTSYSIKSAADRLQVEIFDREVRLRRLLDTAQKLKERGSPEVCENAARAFRDESLSFEDSDLQEFLVRLYAARHLVSVVSDETTNEVAREIEKQAPLAQVANASDGMHISTRQAIQATLATAIASILGVSVSPDRWYWASIAAFMVFVGTSRGETMIRASLRTLGTVAGLIVGFLIAYLLSGHRSLEWAFIIGSIFCALFATRIAFGFWTATLFTLMVAILFDLIGQLSFDILILRLEETLVGSVVGAVVGAFVLPNSTHEGIRRALAKFLRTSASVIEEIPSSAKPFERRSTIKRLRDLDRDLMALRVAAAPVTTSGSLMKRSKLIGVLHAASALNFFLRHLVIDVKPEDYASERAPLAQALRTQANRFETPKDLVLYVAPDASSIYWLNRVHLALRVLSEKSY